MGFNSLVEEIRLRDHWDRLGRWEIVERFGAVDIREL